MPLRHRHGYPAALHRGLPAAMHKTTQEFPYQHKHPRQGYAPHPAHIRQIRGRQAFKGRRTWFLSYSSPSRSPDPHHLAVLTRPGFVRAAPTHPGTSRGRLPSASPPCCDRVSGEGLSPPLEQQRLTAHVPQVLTIAHRRTVTPPIIMTDADAE